MAIIKTLDSKQIEVHCKYIGFEDISIEDIIYSNEKKGANIILFQSYDINLVEIKKTINLLNLEKKLKKQQLQLILIKRNKI